MSSTTSSTAILAIRPAAADDAAALAQLAALDSATIPAGDLLLGVIDGRTVAALALADGAVVADPFTPTAELVALLRQRAARLQPTRRRRRSEALAALRRRAVAAHA